MSLLPGGWGYNVGTLLLLGWCVVDVLIAVAVYPLLRERRLIFQLLAWGKSQLAPNAAEVELKKVKHG